MVTRTVSTTYDDLYGEPGATTIKFRFQDAEYEIDLLHDGKELMEAFQPFIEKGRRTGTTEPVKLAKAHRSRGDQKAIHARTTAIREWARDQGIHVGEKGIIATDIKNAYDAAVRAEND